MRELTDLQRKTLEYIRTFTREHGYPPARKDLMAGLGVRNKSVVDQRISALRDKGWLELGDGRHRSLRLLCEELPLIVAGTVAAGEPILADERVKCRIPRAVAEMFRPEPDFFLRIQGESMSRLGLKTGSLVAIKSQPTAEDGAVVVARVDDEITLKRYYRMNERQVELRPESADPEHQPIEVDLASQTFEICGVAVGALIGEGFNGPEDVPWGA